MLMVMRTTISDDFDSHNNDNNHDTSGDFDSDNTMIARGGVITSI